MNILCKFGLHKYEAKITDFVKKLVPGKFDGEHQMRTYSYCARCKAVKIEDSILTVKDNLNILKRNQISDEKRKAVIFELDTNTTNVSMEEISSRTGVSVSTVRRIHNELEGKF